MTLSLVHFIEIIMFIKVHKKEKGFSIGEVMVAMFILLVGMVDAIFLTVRSMGELYDSRDAIIATLLAQEGVELVRNVRDNNVTQMTCGSGGERCTAFERALSDAYGFPSTTGSNILTCIIDCNTTGTQSEFLCNSSPSKLYLNPETGMYTHKSGGSDYDDPQLERQIYIEYDTSGTEGIGDLDLDNPEDVDKLIANVTSVVVFGGGDFPPPARIKDECKISKGCVYAQTRLTSWINYGD